MRGAVPVEGTRWPTVLAVFAAGVSAAFALIKVSPALPVLRGALGLDLTQAGWLMSTVTLAMVLLGLPAGLLCARIGAGRVIVAGLVVLAAGSAAGALAASFPPLLATRALEGLGLVLVTVAGPVLVGRVATAADRPRALALWGIWLPVGGLAVLLAAPGLMTRWGWAAVWWASAGLAIAACAGLAGRRTTPTAATPPPGGAGTLRVPAAWGIGLLFASFTFQLYAVVTFAPVVLVERAGVSPALASWATALTMIGSALAGGGVSLRVGQGGRPERLVLGGFAVLAALLPLLPAAAAWGGAGALLLLVHGLACGTAAAGIYAWAPRLVPPEAMGVTMGLLMAGNGLGVLLGPPAVGALLEAGVSLSVATLPPAVIAAAGAGLAWWLRRSQAAAA